VSKAATGGPHSITRQPLISPVSHGTFTGCSPDCAKLFSTRKGHSIAYKIPLPAHPAAGFLRMRHGPRGLAAKKLRTGPHRPSAMHRYFTTH